MKRVIASVCILFASLVCISCRLGTSNSVTVELRDLSGKGGIGFVKVYNSSVPIGPKARVSGLLYPMPGDEIQVKGKWFWTGEPFEFTTKLSDRNFDRNAKTLFLILQPNLTIDSKWGAIAPETIEEKFLIQKYFEVVPTIVRNQKDDPNFRPLLKQDHFYYRLLRSISAKGETSSYRGWIDVSQPQATLQLGYWMDEQPTFEGWKLKTNTQAILPPDLKDALIVFDVDTAQQTADVYHLSLAKNLDLFEYQPCPPERIENLTPVTTLSLQPAGAYSPPPLLEGLEEVVVDLRE